MGTEMTYRFNTFILADHTPEELALSDNIFAVVLEAAWSGLSRSLKDEASLNMQLATVRRLLSRGYHIKKIRRVLNFIRFYVRFENKESFPKFEIELDQITQNRKAMGIEEAILHEVEQRGIEKGMEKGMEKGIKQGIEGGDSVK